MDNQDRLAQRFEEHRSRLEAVAHQMLGSHTEADDAVQEAWLRLSRTDASAVHNLGGWLTTVVGRVCLDMLRSRVAHREEPLGEQAAELATSRPNEADPAEEALMAESVGLALLVVLDTLTPAERLAFVLHDMFAVPFDEIGSILGRSPNAAKQLASRARQRVQAAEVTPEDDATRQTGLADAFLSASRRGDFAALLGPSPAKHHVPHSASRSGTKRSSKSTSSSMPSGYASSVSLSQTAERYAQGTVNTALVRRG